MISSTQTWTLSKQSVEEMSWYGAPTISVLSYVIRDYGLGQEMRILQNDLLNGIVDTLMIYQSSAFHVHLPARSLEQDISVNIDCTFTLNIALYIQLWGVATKF